MEPRILIAVAALFGIGAAIIGTTSFLPGKRHLARGLWRLFFIQFLIVGCVLVPAFTGGAVYLAVLIAFTLRCQYELYRAYGVDPRERTQVVGSLCGAAVIAAGFYLGAPAVLHAAVLGAALTLLASLGRDYGPANGHARLVAILGLVYPSVFIAHLALLQRLPDGFVLLFFVYVLAESNDTFAMLAGRLFGRTRLFPVLSPGKTLEGAVGGVGCALAVGLVLNHFIFHLPRAYAAGAVIVVVAGALAGDLVSSGLKRDRGIKDFPVLIEGQGGLLDIYDSLILSVPLFYLYYTLVPA